MNGSIERVTETQVRREMRRMGGQESRRRMRIGMLVVLLVAIAFSVLSAKYVFQLVSIRTDGMKGALLSGDVVLCEKTTSPLYDGIVETGALALVRYNDSGLSRQTVRRVIALAGDEVVVEPDGHVTVNGAALYEPYAAYRSDTDWSIDEDAAPGGALENPFASPEDEAPRVAEVTQVPDRVDDMDYPFMVPGGMLFVMCDNREDLMDSRSSRFGLVKDSEVLALARAVIWPTHRVRTLLGGDIVK